MSEVNNVEATLFSILVSQLSDEQKQAALDTFKWLRLINENRPKNVICNDIAKNPEVFSYDFAFGTTLPFFKIGPSIVQIDDEWKIITRMTITNNKEETASGTEEEFMALVTVN